VSRNKILVTLETVAVAPLCGLLAALTTETRVTLDLTRGMRGEIEIGMEGYNKLITTHHRDHNSLSISTAENHGQRTQSHKCIGANIHTRCSRLSYDEENVKVLVVNCTVWRFPLASLLSGNETACLSSRNMLYIAG
jgi:hypothetical protein